MQVGSKPKFLIVVWKLVLFISILKPSMLKMKKTYNIANHLFILDLIVVAVPQDKEKQIL
jgi:hypothetical protein